MRLTLTGDAEEEEGVGILPRGLARAAAVTNGGRARRKAQLTGKQWRWPGMGRSGRGETDPIDGEAVSGAGEVGGSRWCSHGGHAC